MNQSKIVLSQAEMPRQWYNIQADLPVPLDPPMHPATGQPVGPEDLQAIFPMELIMQEVSQERYIEIPEEVLQAYTLWRPSPLQRARRLEKALDTPAHIYFKNESVSPAGSHKPNTAVPQAYYNKMEGITRISTETGAGQWGSALSLATGMFGLKCTVYMVRVSYDQKPYRKSMIQVWGAEINPSPSELTEAGKRFLAQDPDTPGTLGMAITEAVEDAATHDDTNYSWARC
jgi:tryptophan synthase beta chain